MYDNAFYKILQSYICHYSVICKITNNNNVIQYSTPSFNIWGPKAHDAGMLRIHSGSTRLRNINRQRISQQE